MIVLDASVAVLGLLRDGDSRAALAHHPIAAPHLIDTEVAHALRGQVARGEVPARAADTAVSTWQRLGVRRFASVRLLDRVWALRQNVTAYDAAYVALAEALGCDLWTADARLAQAPGPTCTIAVVRT